MRIPRHWGKAERTELLDDRPYRLIAWGWSEQSEAQARERAVARLAITLEKLRRGEEGNRYDYHADPLREELLETIGAAESPLALITRNGYGCRVLNTARVFFADVDVEEEGGFFRFFRRGSPKERAIARVEEWVERNPGAGFRIYETPAGLRLLATDGVLDPESDESDALLKSLRSDPLYRRLCRAQRCYRARLSAKPWRVGVDRNPVRFPEDATRDLHRAWCERYDPIAAGYAACRFVKQVGLDSRITEIEQVIALHDEHSGARRTKPLA